MISNSFAFFISLGNIIFTFVIEQNFGKTSESCEGFTDSILIPAVNCHSLLKMSADI